MLGKPTLVCNDCGYLGHPPNADDENARLMKVSGPTTVVGTVVEWLIFVLLVGRWLEVAGTSVVRSVLHVQATGVQFRDRDGQDLLAMLG